jgi:hypothetical protein
MKVTSENTEPTRGSISRFTAEASELGLPPGQWPKTLETSLGNGQPFVLFSVHDGGTRHYEQDKGCITLLVYND